MIAIDAGVLVFPPLGLGHELYDLVVVHPGGVLDLIHDLIEGLIKIREYGLVHIVLAFDFVLEVVVLIVQSLVEGCLITLLVDAENEIPVRALEIDSSAESIIHRAKGVVKVPERAGDQLIIGIVVAVAVEQKTSGADIVILDVLLDQVYFGKARNVDVIAIRLISEPDVIPSTLEPGTHRIDRCVFTAVNVLQVAAQLLDGDEIIDGRPVSVLAVKTFQLELGITAFRYRRFLIVVLFDQVTVGGDIGVRLGRDSV